MNFKLHNRRYTGSKKKLSDWIYELIKENCQGETLVDIFAGTGIIAYEGINNGFSKVILNDFLYSNNIIYKAFLDSKTYNVKKLNKFIDKINKNNIDEDNYFSVNFGDKYFTYKNAKKIGYARELLEECSSDFNEKEFNILLASIIYTADKYANTVGHYDAYFRKMRRNDEVCFKLIEPVHHNSDVHIYREDANELIKNISGDVLYIDPPYNSRQYSRFYHVLETLTKWDKPKLHGVALKPNPENMSDYSRKNAINVFENLILNSNFKYIVVSYNNTYNSKSNSSKNKITHDEIIGILKKRGNIKMFSKEHKHFNSGNTDLKNHKEYLFITEVQYE